MAENEKPLPSYRLYKWRSGAGNHGERIVVGVNSVPGYMSGRQAQTIADEIIFNLCYVNDLHYPEGEVFV